MKGLAFTYESDHEITKSDMVLLEMQEWKEWKEVNWYDNPPLKKPGIPTGKRCNPDWDKWCPYCVGDYCLKYRKRLLSTGSISTEFSGQQKCDICRKEYPKGLDMTQLLIKEALS